MTAEIRKECCPLSVCPLLSGSDLDRSALADSIPPLLGSNFAANVKFVLNVIAN